ncbi:hybrid sensor histidine kinase/response regulator [Legionella sp. km772]|uniref:hybrid sensor histidine kinase/response regulator n=1 Tax=Legionella sp. km772 TaxID=2498111 RepID=UPI000F8CD0E6|nr:hybrid sensor histidine kinase/response regulator [Legionella sp. km772]RUR05509.1 hybrid sensor histidine kinase/response regulator [Legionella sp. km772]
MSSKDEMEFTATRSDISSASELIDSAWILIVDDNSDMRDYLKRIIGLRWNVETAANGDAALERLKAKKFDLVITDLMMPKLDGYGLVKSVRADPLFHNIPIIILSARSETTNRIEGLDFGADDYLIKPFVADEVLARVSAHLKKATRYQLAAENERLRKEKEIAEKDSHAKNLFLATLSHELRTPLTAILCWIGAIKHKKYQTAQIEKALAAIEENALAQTELVNTLLDISTILVGKMYLSLTELNIVELIKEAIALVQKQIKEKNIFIDFQTPQESLILLLNHERMAQVFNNLLMNSIKFTQASGTIKIWIEDNEDLTQIHVQDNGQGIAPEFLPMLFKPFTQFDSSLSRESNGLGLGLVLVRNLLELQGASIEIYSEGLTKGTKFTIFFPKLERKNA